MHIFSGAGAAPLRFCPFPHPVAVPMDGAPDSSQFWAKLKYRDGDRSTGEVVAWHPLLAHSADVASRLVDLKYIL